MGGGTEGIKTVERLPLCRSTIKPGTSASDLHQGRLETGVLLRVGEPRSKAMQCGVTGNLVEDEALCSVFDPPTEGGMNCEADKEAQPDEHQNRYNAGVSDGLR